MSNVKAMGLDQMIDRLITMKEGDSLDFAADTRKEDLDKVTEDDLECWLGAKVINIFDQPVLVLGSYGGYPVHSVSLADDKEYLRDDIKNALEHFDEIGWECGGCCYIVEDDPEKEKTPKYIAREIEPEARDFSHYFDDDGFKSVVGAKYAIYIFNDDNIGCYNEDESKDIIDNMDAVLEAVSDTDEEFGKATDAARKKLEDEIKKIVHDCSSEKAGKIADWARRITDYNEQEFRNHGYIGEFIDTDDCKVFAEYLSIVNEASYEVMECHGYSQGDYCEVVYCTETHSEETMREAGKFWLGCGTEYCIGARDDEIYGYYVPDKIRWASGETLQKYLADEYGCKPEELEVICYDGKRITPVYKNLKGEEVDKNTANPKKTAAERD